MTYTRAQALARAIKSRTYPRGMCYRWTREQYGIPAIGDRDGDGDADAVDGWHAAKRRHPGDRRPPGGVPVFWSGGSSGHGHAAITTYDGRVRSIDANGFGNVGTVDLGWFERTWGLKYLGWTEDLGGIVIPNPARRSIVLRASFVNVPTKVGPAAWRQCFNEATERGDITGIVEAFAPAAKRLYAAMATDSGRRLYGTGPNPIISNPRVWTRFAGSVHKLHGRGPYWGRFPGFNAPRYATAAAYRHADPHAPDVAVINTHWVPRGPKVPEWWRKRARAKSIREVTAITRAHLAAGRVVLFLGDPNMFDPPSIPGVHWIAGSGVDHIGIACPDGVAFDVATSARFEADTDHKHGIAVAVRIIY